jgi:hypothetical protein
MTAPSKVQVVIYDAPTAAPSSCACGCSGPHGQGGDELDQASLELQARALALTLEGDFPGRVQVDYINVLKDPRGPSLAQTALLCSLAYPAPLVYINGQGRFAGALPVERIREEIAAILEEK